MINELEYSEGFQLFDLFGSNLQGHFTGVSGTSVGRLASKAWKQIWKLWLHLTKLAQTNNNKLKIRILTGWTE